MAPPSARVQDLIDIRAESPVGTSVKVTIVRDKKNGDPATVVIGAAQVFADNSALRAKGSSDAPDCAEVKSDDGAGASPGRARSTCYKGKGQRHDRYGSNLVLRR